MLELNRVYNMDCLEGMKMIEPGSVDMILCDLPYGETQNAWDSIIPLNDLWEQYHRIAKDTAAILFTSIQPFTSQIVMSNPKAFKYEMVWEKNIKTGFLNAKIQPLRSHETVLVFYNHTPVYNPQGIKQCYIRCDRGSKHGTGDNYGTATPRYNQTVTGYPSSVIKFNSVSSPVHPTQKPPALFEYLIKTYTNPGDVVLDPTMGSGTTAEACQNTQRQFIGFEKDPVYFKIIQNRIGANCRKLEEWADRGVTSETELREYAIKDMM